MSLMQDSIALTLLRIESAVSTAFMSCAILWSVWEDDVLMRVVLPSWIFLSKNTVVAIEISFPQVNVMSNVKDDEQTDGYRSL